MTYDVQGRQSLLTRANSANSTATYDPVSRLASLAHDPAGTTNDVSYSWTDYNPASQVTQRSVSNSAYVFSGSGNVTGAYSPNGLNQYNSAGGNTYSYDPNGNLTSDGATTFGYDVENRLVSATGAKNAALKYDPHGRLYEVSSGGVVPRLLYDGGALIAEYSGSGSLLRRYVHGGGADSPAMWYEGSACCAARRMLHADNLGSIVAVSDSTGAAIIKNSYDAYGARAATNQGRFAFTGQIEIPELGLYYYKARFYSATIGRFMQTDPIGYKDNVNLYAYVGNDPMNATDPTGLARCGKIEAARCADAKREAHNARDESRAVAAYLRKISSKMAAGQKLEKAESDAVDLVRSRFGKRGASASGLNRVASGLDKVADKIGEEDKGIILNDGDNEPDQNGRVPTAYVESDGFNITSGDNVYLNSGFFDYKGEDKSIYQQRVVVHETGHIVFNNTVEFYSGSRGRSTGQRAEPLVAMSNRDPSYDMFQQTDAYACAIWKYRGACE